jgi:hypothetical protein
MSMPLSTSLPTRWTPDKPAWRHGEGVPVEEACLLPLLDGPGQICRTAPHRVLAGTHVQHRHRWRRGRRLGGASSDLIRATARRCPSRTERALGCFIEVTLFCFRQKMFFCWNLILVRFNMVAMLAALLRSTRAARNIWINKRTKWKHAKEALTVSDLAWICQHHLQQYYVNLINSGHVPPPIWSGIPGVWIIHVPSG